MSREGNTWGIGSHCYRADSNWSHTIGSHGPDGMVTGIAVGTGKIDRDRLYAFQRDPEGRVLVYERNGNFLGSWGTGIFFEPHNISVTCDQKVICTDRNDHTVRIFTIRGNLQQTLGTADHAGLPGEPFNKPCHAVADPVTGAIWDADGYGNARIHRFSSDGNIELSFGTPGSGDGQFNLPHSLALDSRGRLIVVDRENYRLQIFNQEGRLLDIWGTDDLRQPMDIHVDEDGFIYVAECFQRIPIYNPNGEIISRWGEKGDGLGQFPSFLHGVCTDSYGDLYIADDQRLQKFERIR